MRKILFLCFLICSIICLNAQDEQQNKEQKLLDIIAAGQYFEAKDYYANLIMNGDTLHPIIGCYYKYNMNHFLNKPDSAAIYLDELLTEYRPFGLLNMEFYFRLWTLYAESLQDYEKALYTCNRIRAYIEENPDGADEPTLQEWMRWVADWERQTRNRMVEPVIKIRRDSLKNNTVSINDSIGLLTFEATYNKKNSIRTLFDTGVTDFFVMDKDIAESIGIRKYPVYGNDTTITINGVETPGYSGILDSIQFANIKLFNVPILIWDRKFLVNISDSVSLDSLKREEVNDFEQSFEVVMGLKAMSLIGKIKLDWMDNVLCFPTAKEDICPEKKPTIFIFINNLFTQIKINNLSLTACIDLGANRYINMDSRFYEKYKEDILIDKLEERDSLDIVMLHRVRQNIPYEIVDNPSVIFNGKRLNIEKNNKVYITSLMDWNTPGAKPENNPYLDITEGVLGYDFFKSLGEEILFDFRTMRIDILEQNKEEVKALLPESTIR